MRILKVLISAIFWGRATYLAANEKYAKALKYLDLYERYCIRLDEEFYLLRGFLNFSLKNDKQSVLDLLEAVNLISNSIKMNSDEKIYLTNYSCLILIEAGAGKDSFVTNDDFSIDKVANHLRVKFPYEKKGGFKY